MTFGDASRILLATCIFSNVALAEFEGAWWPSDDAARVSVSTNLTAVLHTVTFVQTSTTNFIPDLHPTNPYVFHTPNTVWGYADMPGVQTNYRVWTNYYLTHIGLTNGLEYGEPATGRVETIEVCYFADDGTIDVWAWAFQDNTISNVMVDFSEYVVTNILLHTEDLWSWDTYEAWRKRYREMIGDSAAAGLPWYYRDAEDNLSAIKSGIKSSMSADPYFSGLRWYSSTATNNPMGGANAPSAYSISNLLVDAVLPTNWFDVTFRRDLSGAMAGEGHEVTSVYTIIATNGSVVTNNWLDYTNGVHQAIGTNGMQFTHDCINPQVPEGHTTADYGYKHVPKLLSLLDTLGTVSGQLPPRYTPVMTAGPYRYALGTNYTLAASSWAATTNVNLDYDAYEVMFGRPSTAVYVARRARPRSVLTTKAPEFNRKSVVHYSFGPTAWTPGTNIFADLDSVLPVGATPGWYTFGELAYSTNAVLTNLTFVVSGSDAFPGVGYGGIATNRYYGISASDTLWLMKYDWDSPK